MTSERIELARQLRFEAGRRFEYLRECGFVGDTLRAVIARDYVTARDALDTLRAEHRAEEQKRAQAAAQRIYGASDLRGSTDPHVFSSAYRDAQARATATTKPDEAERLMRQAMRTGDTLLARAVAAHAYDRGWKAIQKDYGDANADWAEAVTNHGDTRISVGLGAAVAFGARRPPELRHMQEADIDRLVKQNAPLFRQLDNPKPAFATGGPAVGFQPSDAA